MLTDGFHRNFAYLRLSVTDACNFRCGYCLPNGYQKTAEDPFLTLSEIRRLTTAFAEMGFWKIRITGGEPTVRRDILEIARLVAETPGVERVALSTNGYKLSALAKPLLEAGVTHVNVSVDSLDRKRFAEITGQDKLDEVLAGIRTAMDVGFSSVKVNAVLMKEWTQETLDAFLVWAREAPIAIRFIELMRTGDNQALFESRHLSSTFLQTKLLQAGWKRKEREAASGPAVEFSHEEYRGSVGIIAPYSTDFCVTCNRLRISARGELRLCLFGEGGHSLRPLLQDDSQKEELKTLVHRLIFEKKASHYLQEGRYGATRNFATIGG